MLQEFNETIGLKKGIIVEAFSQGNISDLTEKVVDAANKKVEAEDIPDIFAAYADTAYVVDQLGLVAELDRYLTEEELNEYRSEYLEEGRFDKNGALKIFPTAKSAEVMILNSTDWKPFAQATGVQLSDLETMEGVAEVGRQYYEWTDSLTETPNDGKAFWGRDAMANYIIIGCKQLELEIFSVRDGEMTLQLDREIMRKLWDCYYVPTVKGYFESFGRFRSDDAKTGDIIALVGSTTGATYFPDQVNTEDGASYAIECTMLPVPTFAGGENAIMQQGASMVVTKSDESTEYAATVFLKWFTEAQRNIGFSASSGYLPVKNEANQLDKILPALESVENGSAKELLKNVYGNDESACGLRAVYQQSFRRRG